MLILASLTYALTVVAPPAGTELVTEPSASFGTAVDPPPTIALSQRGSVAAIVAVKAHVGPGATELLVVRDDGTRLILKPPPKGVLYTAYAPGAPAAPGDDAADPQADYTAVALAGDGTPLVTVSLPFSGAYSGVNQGIFVWNGARWRAALSGRQAKLDPPNVVIAAADTPARFACNGNYLSTFPILDRAETEPHYQENAAFLIAAGETLALGYGSATALRGTFVAGYSDGERSVTVSGAAVPPSVALEWHDGRRTALGPGTAYGVNAAGDAVGNDDPRRTGAGRPMLWRDGRAVRLSDAPGSAYAIADDGTIVGAVSGHAFVMRGSDPARRLVRIETLTATAGWTITAAYGIAGNGRILALGHHGHGPPRLLLLDPRRPRASRRRSAPPRASWAQMPCGQCRFGPRTHAELRENPRDVIFYRTLGNEQRLCDVAIGRTVPDLT